jgi:hypothetical protein
MAAKDTNHGCELSWFVKTRNHGGDFHLSTFVVREDTNHGGDFHLSTFVVREDTKPWRRFPSFNLRGS